MGCAEVSVVDWLQSKKHVKIDDGNFRQRVNHCAEPRPTGQAGEIVAKTEKRADSARDLGGRDQQEPFRVCIFQQRRA